MTGTRPQRVRIIGGLWKRTPLAVVDAPGLRPTPDRVRETLFNWLGQTLDACRCLDVFAGTGALGLEAASRGAARVVMIEQDLAACRAIAQSIGRLKAGDRVQLLEGDALARLARLAREGQRFDLVFLDPPFGQGWLARVLPLLPPLLAEGALIYAESEAAVDDWPSEFSLERAARAGHVHYHLLRFGGEVAPGR